MDESFEITPLIVMKKYLTVIMVLFLIVALFFILRKNFMRYHQ